MAEQSPVENSHVSDFIRKRRKKALQAEGTEPQKRRRSLPPKRGIIKKIDKNTIEEKAAAGRVNRKSNNGLPPRQPISVKKPTIDSSPQRKAPQTQPAPRTPSGFNDPAMERIRLEEETQNQQRVEEAKKKLAPEPPPIPTSEKEKQRIIERDGRIKARGQAKKRAEEIRIQKEKDAEIKRLEVEKKRKEREVELKQQEKIRLQKEREEEQKRLELEKEKQEKERSRIYEKIELCKGSLTEDEKELAIKIANEMVKRNIEWKGYISLHSGIGGAMLR